MYIKGVDKRIFKDFKKEYLEELKKAYTGKMIAVKFFNDLNDVKIKFNLKVLNKFNINYWLIRGWSEEEAKEKIKEVKEKRKKPKYTCLQREFWINKGLSEEEAKEKIREIQVKNNRSFNNKRNKNPHEYKTSSPMKVEFWINKGMSEKDAIYKIKSQRKLNKEYWLAKGFCEEESIKKVKNFQSKQSKKVKNRVNSLTIDFYKQQGFDEEESLALLKERQAVGRLDKFIDRYGEEEGTKRWEQRQIKWQKTLQDKPQKEKDRINKLKGITLENMIRKWGEIEGPKKYNDWFNKRIDYLYKNNKFYSNISQELFNKLLIFIEDKENVKFATHNNELFISYNKKIYFYDFCYKDKIIEFNGDIWHGNPKYFKSDDYPNPCAKELSAKDIWDLDKIKYKVAKDKGYDILTIWESDYNKNSDHIIEICYNFLFN